MTGAPKDGNTALHWAVVGDVPSLLRQVMAKGIPYNVRNKVSLQSEQATTLARHFPGRLVFAMAAPLLTLRWPSKGTLLYTGQRS